MTHYVTCLILNKLDQRMLLIILKNGDQSIKNSFVYHFRSCRQSYIRKKLISISKMYVSSEKTSSILTPSVINIYNYWFGLMLQIN